ncbi:rRNA maturation RNase YbeY [Roseivirga sp. BDSF3-8]|uniref:rRNA maturation RNase YbeY n=1 Tax=Roseivirga sp. BDSF3-8 TaxID=3241598 RepID=UPI003531D228
MGEINYFSEDVPYQLIRSESITKWLHHILSQEHFTLESLNYIFCSDEYLHKINVEYLNHDTYTDIITFDNSETEHTIEGDIFISVDRVSENASVVNTTFEDELHRVMAHGLLHLLGQGDKTEEDKKMMSEKEDRCLSLRSQFLNEMKRST